MLCQVSSFWYWEIAFVIGLVGIWRFWVYSRKQATSAIDTVPEDGNSCRRCGYDLTGLTIPRCPECGALIGFDKDMRELGLTNEEIGEIERKNETATSPPMARKANNEAVD